MTVRRHFLDSCGGVRRQDSDSSGRIPRRFVSNQLLSSGKFHERGNHCGAGDGGAVAGEGLGCLRAGGRGAGGRPGGRALHRGHTLGLQRGRGWRRPGGAGLCHPRRLCGGHFTLRAAGPAGQAADRDAGPGGLRGAPGHGEGAAADRRAAGVDLFPEPDPGAYRLHPDPDPAAAQGDESAEAGSARGGLCPDLRPDRPLHAVAGGLRGDISQRYPAGQHQPRRRCAGPRDHPGHGAHGMAVPVGGMALGLAVALFISYRKPRDYEALDLATTNVPHHHPESHAEPHTLGLVMAGVAIVAALGIQLWTGSMVLGGLVGFALLSVGGIFRWREADDLFTSGMRMMALIGFIMISASGFAAVMNATGHIDTLVQSSFDIIGDNRGLAALIMLLVGLFITLGIGSSFSTIPIIAAIFVPLAVQFGFSPLATVALVGTAAALGDAGSPASDSTLGPTSGLNVDRQHDHIWDSVVPTFLHYNIPLIAFGWAAAMLF